MIQKKEIMWTRKKNAKIGGDPHEDPERQAMALSSLTVLFPILYWPLPQENTVAWLMRINLRIQLGFCLR